MRSCECEQRVDRFQSVRRLMLLDCMVISLHKPQHNPQACAAGCATAQARQAPLFICSRNSRKCVALPEATNGDLLSTARRATIGPKSGLCMTGLCYVRLLACFLRSNALHVALSRLISFGLGVPSSIPHLSPLRIAPPPQCSHPRPTDYATHTLKQCSSRLSSLSPPSLLSPAPR